MAVNKNKILASAQKYVQRGAFDKAIREYLRIIDEDPKDVRTLLRIGDLHARRGDAAAAGKTYERVAQAYTEQGFFQKAVAVYKQILKVDPAQFEITLKLAELYQELGLVSNSIEQYQVLAGYYERQGRTRDTTQIFKRIVELDPENVASRVRLAEMLSRDGKGDDGIAEFERACEQLLRQSRLDDYIKVAERLLFLDPGKIDETRRLAKVYLDRGDARRALAKLQICFRADARNLDTLTFLAETFRALGQLPKAISVWRELAKLYEEREMDRERERVLDRIREVAPDDSFLRAQAPSTKVPQRATSQRAGRASESASTPAAAVVPVAAPIDAEKILGEVDVFIEYGLVQRAREHLDKILAKAPKHPAANERLAKVAERMGDGPVAARALARWARSLESGSPSQREVLEKAMRLDPGSADVLEALEAAGLPVPTMPRAERTQPAVTEAPAAPPRRAPGMPPPHPAKGARHAPPGEEIIIVDDGEEEGRGDETVFGPPPGLLLSAVAPARATGAPIPEAAASPPLPVELTPEEVAEEVELELDAVEEIDVEGTEPVAAEEVEAALGAIDELTGEVPPWDPQAALGATEGAASLIGDGATYDLDDLRLDTGAFALPETGDRTLIAPLPPELADLMEPSVAVSEIDVQLGEAEFFLQQGLVEEGRLILEQLVGRYPGRADLRVRLDALGAPVAPAPVAPELAPALADDPLLAGLPEASELDDALDDITAMGPPPPRPEDAEGHYDLGIAYQEMGLFDEAIRELREAMRVPRRELDALVRVGACLNALGRHDEAVRDLKRGLSSPRMSEAASIDFFYGLGVAYDGLGDAREALYYLRRVHASHRDFGDVPGRIQRLSRIVDDGGGAGRASPARRPG